VKDALISYKEKASSDFENENWEDAVEGLNLWAETARNLANTFFKVVEPVGRRSETISLKSDAEKYQKEANKARIMQAEAYLKLGDHEKAYNAVMEVFDHLEDYEMELWKSAVSVLEKIIK